MRRARNLLQLAFLAVTSGVFGAVVALGLYAFPLTDADSASYTLFNLVRMALLGIGVLTASGGVLLAVRAVLQRTDNDLAMLTARQLAPYLDDRYTFIRNVSRRGLGYIDGLLVGPAGIVVFRVVDFEGAYLNEAGKWLTADGQGGWKPSRVNPTADAVADMKSLKTYLGLRDFTDLPIFGFVVFVKDDPQARLTLKSPVIPATHLSSLYERLRKNYLAKDDRIDQATADAIVNLLYEDQ